MLNERLLADGAYEELEVIEIPAESMSRLTLSIEAEVENYKSSMERRNRKGWRDHLFSRK